ncbi:hypothetical protein Pelo_7741 [Pelomyxa schiedti]|nr:hypothetical protein Pelo_7741 [Pelomyxa schiedti]
MQNSLAVFQQYLCSNGAPSCENSILLEVNRDLLTNHYDHAFDLTLSQQDLELVVWLCSTIDITNGEAMVSERAAVLKSMTQPVLLSLLQQLAFDLSSHTLLKVPLIRPPLSTYT